MESTESIYGGGTTYLEPTSYNSVMSPYISFSDIGFSQDARMANQVKDTSKHLNTGAKVFEVAGHSPEVFEAMPDEQLTELKRVAEITGTEPTIHAPMIDPVGINQDRWDEVTQKAAEKQLWSAVKRSHELKPDGNLSVTMHASTAGLPFPEFKVKEGKKEELQSFLFIGPEGRINQIKKEEKFFPGEAEKEFTIKNELEKENNEQWGKQIQQLNFYARQGADSIKNAEMAAEKFEGKSMEEIKQNWKELIKKHPEARDFGSPEQIENSMSYGRIVLKDSYRNLEKLYNMGYKHATEQDKKKLDVYANKIAPIIKEFDENEKDPKKLALFAEEVIEEGVKVLDRVHPALLIPLREFAVEKSADTVSNIAVKSYNKFKDTSPLINLENHPAGQSILTTGTDLKEVIEEARKQFVEKAIKPESEGGAGLSKGEAKRQSEKLIGATWDVGHINMLRRYGYTKEDIIKETEKVAPFVKHVHLSDNFGFEHTELPMGMGNVPIGEIMQKLNKEGFKGKKVVEALSWWQHFSEQGRHHAILPTLQGISSPIYGMANAPYWNQAMGVQGAYLGFPLAYLPEKHFSTYGSGFGSLPEELGGQIPGTQSRFSGAANA